ncbi:hypothetical protein [Siphonobacter aquaeclarae]|uniref:Uncharacterized protein n=1 Tax=Siphonobacter aquaeclarae TaxID=563176 RepID=A0A1G9T9X4_9BACT|nr:hypothetical protein [Siphonobacter aquaeclarae]SDM44497.1 hypothetical protein SAMN04488090_3476 [Siphonobacter aquaeclarae]
MAKKKNKGILAVLGIGAGVVLLMRKKDPVSNTTTPVTTTPGTGSGNNGNSNLTSPADYAISEIKPLNLPVLDFAVKNSFNWDGLPDFRMPAGTTWVYGSYMFNKDDIPKLLAHGFTHIDIDRAHNVDGHKLLTKAQRYCLVTSNTPQSIAPNFGQNNDTVTTQAKANDAVSNALAGRVPWFNEGDQYCDIYDFDLETGGNDATFFALANAAIAYTKPKYGVKMAWYATGPKGSEMFGGSARWDNFKDKLDYFQVTPYVHDQRAAFGGDLARAKDESAMWIWDVTGWLETSYPRMADKKALSWFSSGWSGDPGGDSLDQFIRPDMAEGMPIWHAIGGGMRNGGGLTLWGFNMPQSYTGMEKKFFEGMYRVSRLNDFFEGAGQTYNNKMEYSEDGGTTWKTDPARTWQTVESMDDPYVRYAQKGNDIVVAAYYPRLRTGQKEILIRKGTWKTAITVKARETFLGRATLPA